MKRLLLVLVATSGTLLLGACGSGEVVVQAQRGGVDGTEPVALQDLSIQLLPYDRDAIFDSLEASYPEPEPQIPDSVLELQNAIAQAQEEWKAAESQWGVVRDSLKTISTRLQGMSRAKPEYVALYRDFQDLDPQEQELKKRMDAAFARFTQLQSDFVSQTEEIKVKRQLWADEAFAPVDSVMATRIAAVKLKPAVDTTTAAGVAQFKVKPGKWWVHARYELPYQELYWNVPVEVERGKPVPVQLTRENAQIRPKF